MSNVLQEKFTEQNIKNFIAKYKLSEQLKEYSMEQIKKSLKKESEDYLMKSKKLLIMCLSLFLAFGICVPVMAKEPEGYNSNKVPECMQPGTIILFDSNTHFIILEKMESSRLIIRRE